MELNNHSKGSKVKASFFILFLVTALVVAHFTPLRDYLTAERLGQLLATSVHFRDYFSGTVLGIIVRTFIFTFFVGTLKEVWSSGQWEGLLSWKVFLSLGLFPFHSLFRSSLNG
ncbi:MAG: hypothetical protein P4L69_16920 [Desulfosporosinus sp.]|nr:hypothetical protein [Desulfosporosinus sp.]